MVKPLSDQRGYTLILALLAVAVMGIAGLTVAESWHAALAREREEEFVFRIAAVRRALARYPVAHHDAPRSLEEVEAAHLIRPAMLTDPITGEGWIVVMGETPQGLGVAEVKSTSPDLMWRVTQEGSRMPYDHY